MNDFQNIISQIFALGLTHLKEKNPAISAFTFAPDTQGQRIAFGSSIRIRVPIIKEAEDFDPEVGFTGQASNYEKFDIAIDKFKKVEFEINLGEVMEDSNVQQIVRDSANIVTESLGLAITKALLTAAGDEDNFPYQMVIPAEDGDYDKIVDLAVGLDNAKAFGDRTIVANPTIHGEFLRDDRVISSNTNSGATSIRNGVLTDIAGFDIAKGQGLPNGTRGIATNKTALAFVPLVPVDLQDVFGLPKVAETGVYTDPDSGVAMYWQAWFDPNKVKARVVALLAFGVGVCREDGLIRIVGSGENNLPVDPSEEVAPPEPPLGE